MIEHSGACVNGMSPHIRSMSRHQPYHPYLIAFSNLMIFLLMIKAKVHYDKIFLDLSLWHVVVVDSRSVVHNGPHGCAGRPVVGHSVTTEAGWSPDLGGSMIEASVTLLGNLVDDPDIRCTQSGTFVCSLRLASTSRRFDRSQNRWIDGHTIFVTVTCWRQLAENVSASLHKGDKALVIGRLRQRSFETQDGTRRVVYEVDADVVAVDLARQSADVRRAVRSIGDGADGDGRTAGSESLVTCGMTGAHNGQAGVGTGTGYHDGGFAHAGADGLLAGSLPDDVSGAVSGLPDVPAQRPATV